MAMVGIANIAKLRKQFKKANQRVDKAIARYKKALQPLYLPWTEGRNPPRIPAKVSRIFIDDDGSITDYVTDLYLDFYRRGCGGKFYVKPQTAPVKVLIWDNYVRDYHLVGQDYLDLLKLEAAIDAAVNERERLLDELEAVGVDVYHDAELWQ